MLSKHTLKLCILGLYLSTRALVCDAQFASNCAPASSNAPKSEVPSFIDDRSGWTENISARTIFTATWGKDDGSTVIEYCKRPLHFLVNGKQERISSEIEQHGNSWLAYQQPFPIKIDQLGGIHTASELPEECVFGYDVIYNGYQAQFQNRQMDAKSVTAFNIVPGVDRELHVSENAVKYQYIIHDVPELSEEFLEITELINAPQNAIIEKDLDHGKMTDGQWKGNLQIKLDGKIISAVQAVLCYDQLNQYQVAGYTWNETKEQGVWQVTTHIPVSWLHAAGLVYPVVIDPLVTGPLAEWGIDFMPSCLIPEYNVDSILVTVPGEISVTGLFVTGSFYADLTASAIMADGAMYYSTSCGATPLFEAQPPADALPGTAYLLSFDMRTPLMCCYEPSCTETSFFLRMHIGRYTPAGDCNTLAVYYNPSTLWPFTAYIEGHTVEKYGAGWTIPSAAVCSNDCEVEGTARMRYGVPPYTVTHPWMPGSVVIETPTPCDLSQKLASLPLVVPGCPVYCPSFNMMDVPPCIITDVCGNVAPDVPAEELNIKPAPDIIAPPMTVCSGLPYTYSFTSCSDESTFNWAGNNTSGEGNIPVLLTNESGGMMAVSYFGDAELNGCHSENTEFFFNVIPEPVANFSMSPDPAFLGSSANFIDESTSAVGDINSWSWSFDGVSAASDQNAIYEFGSLGTHEVCLLVKTEEGCPATFCKSIEVITTTIIVPNIFTPNGDGLNEYLEFKNLNFFPDNQLTVWNRWGNIIYTKSGYANNWSGGDFTEGTYYFILTVANLGEYSGYFQILR